MSAAVITELFACVYAAFLMVLALVALTRRLRNRPIRGVAERIVAYTNGGRDGLR